MNRKYPYLSDRTFMDKVNTFKIKEQLIKITCLDWSETPIQQIQGYIISGNLNLDGNSAIRRNGNLSIVASEKENDLTDIDNLFSVNKKIYIEIGFTNVFDMYTEYPIIWIPEGLFLINSPSLSHSNQDVTINIQLKDKMCLLNGDCGGTLPASISFHEVDELDLLTGGMVTKKVKIFDLIQELVHHWGQEPLEKIIINDIPLKEKQVVKWMGEDSLYLRSKTEGTKNFEWEVSVGIKPDDEDADRWVEYETGSDVGFINVDFIYPDELINNPGDSICSVLDKIKNTLGNFEYFYDVYGNFVFQEIKNYLNTSYIQTLENNNYQIDKFGEKSLHTFEDGFLITSYSNSPNFDDIKNDFIVWGAKTNSVTNEKYPIRYHLAIDEKPLENKIFRNMLIYHNEDEDDEPYSKAQFGALRTVEGDSSTATYDEPEGAKNNLPEVGEEGILYYIPHYMKGYGEDPQTHICYYTWISAIVTWDASTQRYLPQVGGSWGKVADIKANDWRTRLLLQGAEDELKGLDANYYYQELKEEWPKLYNICAHSSSDDEIDACNGILERTQYSGDWQESFKKDKSSADYYLDFIDVHSPIGELSVNNIGRRTKVVQDDTVNCMFEPEIPDLFFILSNTESTEKERDECIKKGQSFLQVGYEIYNQLTIGGSYNSAYNVMQDLLYQYTQYNNTITLNTIPVYYLEPNTRITVKDPKTGIFGDYMINTISLAFDTESAMTLSCTKTLERI